TSLLTCFCVTLTCLFSTNLMQHAVGGLSAVRAHEAMAAVQALFNAATLERKISAVLKPRAADG
ncbi:MAG: hypothetical protein VXY90_11145, partial [Pseudomonadota bacterium]|nr:hypothetical protein [Pseudomonadota bacterium]